MGITAIYDHLERLSNLQRADTRKNLTRYGLQPVQLEALHYLSVCNRYSDTPVAVAEYLGQTKGTVSQTLKVLEKKDLLSRHPDSRDKRVIHLKISPAGEKILRDLIPSPLFATADEQLDEVSSVRITAALKDLLLTIQKANNMQPFGVCQNCRHNREKQPGRYFCELTSEPLAAREIKQICREYQDAG